VNKDNLSEVVKPLALEVGVYYNPHVWRQEEYKAVGRAYAAGYTEVLGDRSSDETVYLVEPQHLEGRTLDDLDEQTLEASLKDYFVVVDIFDWLKDNSTEGKVEEV
jgi:hypothetical protein